VGEDEATANLAFALARLEIMRFRSELMPKNVIVFFILTQNATQFLFYSNMLLC